MAQPEARAKDRALRLLAVRWRSREELRDRLLRAGFHPSEIEPAIEELETAGLVDDERFARELVAHERGRRGSGRRTVVASLRRSGVEAEVVERVTEGLERDEDARAIEVAQRRMSRLRGLEPAVARRRLLSFLLRRGYDYDVARAACRSVLAEGE
jgi:regulatory protein